MWGWGQAAAGDRRGLALPLVQGAALAALAWAAPRLATGTAFLATFLLGVAMLVAWGAVAVHAYRRAVRRRERLDLVGPDGAAAGLLWLGPIVVLGWAVVFGLGGRAADPASTLAWYVADWRAGRAREVLDRFVVRPGGPGEVAQTWDRQATALRDRLVLLAAQSPPGSGIDTDRPFESIRWVDDGRLPDGGRRIAIEVARRETVRGDLLGILPVASQRLVPIARVGQADLRPVTIDVPLPEPVEALLGGDGLGVEEWRIVRVEVAGVELDGG